MIYRELASKWLAYIHKDCSEEHATACDSVYTNHFSPFYNTPCEDISRGLVWGLYESGAWGTPNSGNRNLMLLKGSLNYGVKWGHIEKNPIDKMPKFKQAKSRKYVPPKDHVERIAKVFPQEIRDIYDGYRYTGARPSELRRLTWEHVDLDKNEIILHTRKKRTRDWTGQPVTIAPELRDILTRRKRDGGSSYVFGKDGRQPPDTLNRSIAKACSIEGIPRFTPHALRHYAAHKMAEMGAPTELIQRVLRHEDIKTTQHYLQGLTTAHEAGRYLSDRPCAD